MSAETCIATVYVDGGRSFTGTVYHVRENGWPCIQAADGHIASGPTTYAEYLRYAERQARIFG